MEDTGVGEGVQHPRPLLVSPTQHFHVLTYVEALQTS